MTILLTLAGCGQGTVQEALGMGKRSPDEFAVVSRAPLILPPDYGLRPPAPGESRPGIDTPSERARASLSAQQTQPPAMTGQESARQTQPPAVTDQEVVSAAFDERSEVASSGERALVAQVTTATPADPDIRRQIAEENMQLAQTEQSLFTRLVMWRKPNTLGTVVDPVAETERIRANRAEGKPVTEGESPVITQRRQSVLQGFLSEVF